MQKDNFINLYVYFIYLFELDRNIVITAIVIDMKRYHNKLLKICFRFFVSISTFLGFARNNFIYIEVNHSTFPV
jgi:hypothetical protein